jgi:phosphatidylserine/phosphatidylglycerophosphate/cardiolipin synthase-like enzyme
MSLDLGNLKFYMGPDALGAPDDLCDTIVKFINAAQEELYIAVQELEHRPIAEAIIEAKQRGVKVRVIVESMYLTLDEPVEDAWSPGGANEENRKVFAALLRSKVEIILDLNPETFHQKFVVRDPDGSRAAVLTGSTNFTPTGTGQNLNHIMIMHGKRMAQVYKEEFDEAWNGTFGVKRKRHEPKPKTYKVAGISIKVLFAPDHSPEMEIMKQMLKARKQVDFAMFTFAERSSGIDDTMIALRWANIPVRGVLDRRQGNQKWAATRPLMENGVELWWPKKDSGVRKVHHKLVVIDKQVVIAGSFNYTGPANALNDENIFVVGDIDKPNEKQQQFAQYALTEIERIIKDHCEKVPV